MLNDDILSQKEELIKWKEYLLTLLSNKYYMHKEKLCLIRKTYLDKYENSILNSDMKEDNKKTKFYLPKNDSIENESRELLELLKAPNIKLKDLPKILPINEYNYKYFKNNFRKHPNIGKKINIDNNNNPDEIEFIGGIFGQGLLEIKINELLLLFFFSDNDYLRQGFLQIKNNSEEIIFKLESIGPRNFVKNYNKNMNDKEIEVDSENFNLYILGKFDINIEQVRSEFEKINEEKNFKFMSKSMKLTPSKFSLSLNIENFIKDMDEKIKKNVTNISSIFNFSISPNRKRGRTFCSNYLSQTFDPKKFNEIKKEEELNNNINNNQQINKKNNNVQKSYTENMIKFSNINYDSPNSNVYQFNSNTSNENQIIDYSQEFSQEGPTGLVGLSNIGATCYMNATLQSFSSVDFLREELLNPYFYEKLKNNKESKMRLSFALAEVFKNLWNNSDRKDYPPENFKNVISDMNPLFKGVAANDPKDLILFMLETMHSELKRIDPNIIVDNNFIPNEHILEEVYKDFSNYYLSKNKSIIFDIFFGCTTIITCCMYCHSQTYNVQVNNILFFPLEEVRKFKKKDKETPVTIYDCFDYNQRYDIYESYFCGSCNNNNSTVISYSKYLYTPKVLVINLNRGKGIQFNVKFNFEENIEIKNYVYGKDSPHKYELIGVICHFGESGMGGHFIAFCKHVVNYEFKWYKFNDGFVDESNFNEVQTSGMPYVLFYSFMDVDDSYN